jgi:hypothetical protein
VEEIWLFPILFYYVQCADVLTVFFKHNALYAFLNILPKPEFFSLVVAEKYFDG